MPRYQRRSIAQRLEEDVDRSGACWLWKRHVRRDGYAFMQIATTPGAVKAIFVHRASWEHYRGPIPEGMTVDHLCRVRHCLNPEHLQLVTPRVNTLRGSSQPAINAKKTHCKRGHPLSGENLYVSRKGFRQCRMCVRRRRQAAARRMRAAAAQKRLGLTPQDGLATKGTS